MFRNSEPLDVRPFWSEVGRSSNSVIGYQSSPAERQQVVEHWEAQAQAGSARAAALAGEALWTEQALNACPRAQSVLLRAVELGAREAPYLLGVYFRDAPCTKRKRKEAKAWFDKAMQLGDSRAVGALLSPKRRGSADEEDRARAEVAQRAATDGPILEQPVAAALASDAKAGWSFKVDRVDQTRQCALNVVHNCRGVPFAVRYALTNTLETYLLCRIKVSYAAFGTGEPISHERLAVVAPSATREVFAGEVDNDLPRGSATADCGPLLPDPLTMAPDAMCRARLVSAMSLDDYYPPAALRQEIEGNVSIRVFVHHSGERPADLEVESSSSQPLLDQAALKAMRVQRFSSNCDNAFGTYRLGFKLQR
jgi:TonB family protein